MNFSHRWVIDYDLIHRKLQHEFLSLNSFELLDPLLVDKTGELGVMVDQFADHLEVMFNLVLLQNPHVAGIP